MSSNNMSENHKVIFSYEGRVISGNKIGRKIGVPTVNVLVEDTDDLPQFGVYAAVLTCDAAGEKKAAEKHEYPSENATAISKYIGVANIGVKPTIVNEQGVNPVGIEVNLFDYEGNLYDEVVKVELCKFIRPEKKFVSIEELSKQIMNDIEKTRMFFESATM